MNYFAQWIICVVVLSLRRPIHKNSDSQPIHSEPSDYQFFPARRSQHCGCTLLFPYITLKEAALRGWNCSMEIKNFMVLSMCVVLKWKETERLNKYKLRGRVSKKKKNYFIVIHIFAAGFLNTCKNRIRNTCSEFVGKPLTANCFSSSVRLADQKVIPFDSRYKLLKFRWSALKIML